MTIIELPRRAGPRTFIEPPPDLSRRGARALDALDRLPEGLDLPGLPELGAALVDIADALEAGPGSDALKFEVVSANETSRPLPARGRRGGATRPRCPFAPSDR
jgi:hypothetical protein